MKSSLETRTLPSSIGSQKSGGCGRIFRHQFVNLVPLRERQVRCYSHIFHLSRDLCHFNNDIFIVNSEAIFDLDLVDCFMNHLNLSLSFQRFRNDRLSILNLFSEFYV